MQNPSNPPEKSERQPWLVIALLALCASVCVIVVLHLSYSLTRHAEPAKRVARATPDDRYLQANSQALDAAPPMLLIEPTRMPSDWTPFEMFGDNRYLARGKTVKELMAAVYSQKNSAAKLDFPASLPDDKYDCLVTLQSQTNWWDALESALDEKFHLVAQLQQQGNSATYTFRRAD